MIHILAKGVILSGLSILQSRAFCFEDLSLIFLCIESRPLGGENALPVLIDPVTITLSNFSGCLRCDTSSRNRKASLQLSGFFGARTRRAGEVHLDRFRGDAAKRLYEMTKGFLPSVALPLFDFYSTVF